MIKKRLSALVATTALISTALISTATLAADLPRKALPPVVAPVPVANWSGFYIGGGGGYGMYNLESNLAVVATGAFSNSNGTSGGRGYLATAVVGADYQFALNWVAGVFADGDWTNINGRHNDTGISGVGNLKLKSAWAAGGRIGYLVTPQIMTYLNGGFTEARFDSVAYFPAFVGATPGTGLPAQTYQGYFIGGGVEYMIAPGWFAKSEYRFADHDIRTLTLANNQPVGQRNQPYIQTVRTGINYKFDWSSGPYAQIPVKTQTPSPPNVNWSGFYLGAGGGYGMYNVRSTVVTTTTGAFNLDNGTTGGRGYIATAFIGADYQLTPNWVAGVFADGSWMNIKGQHLESFVNNNVGKLEAEWAWAVGGRIGYLVTPQLMTYVNGGYTQAKFDSVNYTFQNFPSVFSGTTIPEQTYSGYFLGGGVEYAIAPGWFAKSEYRFADYDTRSPQISSRNFIGLLSGFSERLHPYMHTYRVGISYKFNSAGPVIAKY